MTREELDARLALAREKPSIAYMLLSGPSPTCELCGGTQAPIIGGRHLNLERWCEPRSS